MDSEGELSIEISMEEASKAREYYEAHFSEKGLFRINLISNGEYINALYFDDIGMLIFQVTEEEFCHWRYSMFSSQKKELMCLSPSKKPLDGDLLHKETYLYNRGLLMTKLHYTKDNRLESYSIYDYENKIETVFDAQGEYKSRKKIESDVSAEDLGREYKSKWQVEGEKHRERNKDRDVYEKICDSNGCRVMKMNM